MGASYGTASAATARTNGPLLGALLTSRAGLGRAAIGLSPVHSTADGARRRAFRGTRTWSASAGKAVACAGLVALSTPRVAAKVASTTGTKVDATRLARPGPAQVSGAPTQATFGAVACAASRAGTGAAAARRLRTPGAGARSPGTAAGAGLTFTGAQTDDGARTVGPPITRDDGTAR